MNRALYFLMGILFSSQSYAYSCSKLPLQVFFVLSPLEDAYKADVYLDRIESLLRDTDKLIDEKGIGDVVAVYPSYKIDWIETFARIAKSLRIDLPGTPVAQLLRAVIILKRADALMHFSLPEYERAIVEVTHEFEKFGYADGIGLVRELENSLAPSFLTKRKMVVIAPGLSGYILSATLTSLSRYEVAKESFGYLSPLYVSPPKNLGAGYGLVNAQHMRATRDRLQEGVGGRKLPINLHSSEPIDPFDVLSTYLSLEVQAEADGGIVDSFAKHFVEKLRIGSSSLRNNDVRCCEGRPGMLWANTKDCKSESCLGGFVEKTVEVKGDAPMINMDKASMVCEQVKLISDNAVLSLVRTEISGFTTLSGRIDSEDMKISGPSSDRSVQIISGPSTIELKNSSVTGAVLLKGLVEVDESVLIDTYTEGAGSAIGTVTLDGTAAAVVVRNNSHLYGDVEVRGGLLDEAQLYGRIRTKEAQVFNSILSFISSGADVLKVHRSSSCPGILKIWNGTSLSGRHDIEACGTWSSAIVSGEVITRGKVDISNSQVEGVSPSEAGRKLTINGDGTHKIVIQEEANLNGRMHVTGDLLVNGVTITGDGNYSGIVQTVLSGASYVSHMRLGEYSGENNFSGIFVTEADMADVTLQGSYMELTPGDWVFTTVAEGADVGEGATIKGDVLLAGSLGAGATAWGKQLNSNGGVWISELGSFTGTGKTIEGVASIVDSSVSLSSIDGIPTSSDELIIDHSAVNTSTIKGYGWIGSYSDLLNADVDGANYSISNSNLTGTTVRGNARLCGTYGASTYGAGYDDCSKSSAWRGTPIRDLKKAARAEVRGRLIKSQAETKFPLRPAI